MQIENPITQNRDLDIALYKNVDLRVLKLIKAYLKRESAEITGGVMLKGVDYDLVYDQYDLFLNTGKVIRIGDSVYTDAYDVYIWIYIPNKGFDESNKIYE